MDGSLFKKYEQRIYKNKTEKEEVLKYIKERTGVVLDGAEIALDNKKIKIQTSSTKKAFLRKGNVAGCLQEKGYTLSF